MRAHAIWLDGKSAKKFDSDPIAGYRPFSKQRLGLYGSPKGNVRMAWLMGRADDSAFRVAEWKVDIHSAAKNLRIWEENVDGTQVQSAVSVLPRGTDSSEAKCLLLTKTGDLVLQAPGARPRTIRTGLPLTYDFPIFPSAFQTYEAVYDEKGRLAFRSL